jgi:hypothetical protein
LEVPIKSEIEITTILRDKDGNIKESETVKYKDGKEVK